MTCNFPNRIFYTGGINPDTGKRKTLFTSRKTDFIYKKYGADKWNKAIKWNDESINHFKKAGYIVVSEHDDIPCGQCIGCRLDYAREWSTRIMYEKKKYPDNECWFVTVTYDDDHLIPAWNKPTDWVEETGEILSVDKVSEFNSVSVVEHQKFMKRLRKKYGKVRFFCSLEYGTQTARPHAHYIFFGLKIPDLEVYKVSPLGDILYNSKELEKTWKNGFVVIGRVTTESAAYVARYCIKKRNVIDRSVYEKLGIEPERVIMSRNPGIGADMFDISIYDTDHVVMPTKDGSVVLKPPKYFDRLLENIDPLKYEEIINNRKEKASQHDDLLNELYPFYDTDDRLAAQDLALKNSISKLVRNGV